MLLEHKDRKKGKGLKGESFKRKLNKELQVKPAESEYPCQAVPILLQAFNLNRSNMLIN